MALDFDFRFITTRIPESHHLHFLRPIEQRILANVAEEAIRSVQQLRSIRL